MQQALFTNGVFRNVVEEIIQAQENDPNLVSYLQPHSSERIKKLALSPPSPAQPVRLYISTTDNLANICYTADIVGWENKKKISPERRNILNAHMTKYQPVEKEIYETAKGKDCVNLISIRNMRKMANPFLISNLIKVSDGYPHKVRTQSGRWSYVYKLPDWVGTMAPVIKEYFDEDFEKRTEKATNDSPEARKGRLSSASKFPEQVQVVSIAYRRNADVVAEIMARANGKCERCGANAPFVRAKDGSPFLEVHHWKPLSEGGEDTVENAGALCPNCHREVHFG